VFQDALWEEVTATPAFLTPSAWPSIGSPTTTTIYIVGGGGTCVLCAVTTHCHQPGRGRAWRHRIP